MLFASFAAASASASLLFLSLAGRLVTGQTVGACSGSCYGVSHDPNIVKNAAGTYYRFSTGGGINIATASSIAGPWTLQGQALDSSTDRWAPDVTLVNGFYYMYYAVSSFGSQDSHIGLARSTTMDVGTWEDLGTTGVVSTTGSAYNAIDPNLIDVSGTYLMSFGSFWGDIYQTQLTTDPTTIDGTPYNIALNSSGSHAVEGSFVYHSGSFYYLFFSSGVCCNLDVDTPAPGDEYRINVCRSSSASGPYVDASGVSCTEGGGTTVLASHDNVYAPGGQGVLTDTTGPILYYHYADLNLGKADADKQLGWNPLDFSSGWPVVENA